MIQPGTYNLAAGGGTLYVNRPVNNVTLRGSTGRCDDVVLVGAGMTTQGNTPFGIWVGGPVGMLIANLTVRDIYYHPIMLEPNYGTQRPRLYNVRLINAGEQFVKASPIVDSRGKPTGGIGNGVVEYSIIEYEAALDPGAPGGPTYTNGVDVHHGSNWIIRHNLFRNIRAAPGLGLAGPAVLLWNGTRDSIVEGNLFLNTQRGIAFGLSSSNAADHVGGIIRNNIFYRSGSQDGDVAIGVSNSPNTKVLNNTVILSGSYPNAIEYRFSGTTGVVIEYNLTDSAIRLRDGASGRVTGNVTNPQASWFVDLPNGDLRLSAAAVGAIDRAQVLSDVSQDYDGRSRPIGSSADVGASEFGGSEGSISAPGNLAVKWTDSLTVTGSRRPERGDCQRSRGRFGHAIIL